MRQSLHVQRMEIRATLTRLRECIMDIQVSLGYFGSSRLRRYIQVSALSELQGRVLIGILLASEDVDTAKIREDKVRLSKVGEIMVMVHRYRAGPASTKRSRYKGGKDLNDEYDSAVHEKALKGEAKSHGVSYVFPVLIIES
jgi:hypothetical protein